MCGYILVCYGTVNAIRGGTVNAIRGGTVNAIEGGTVITHDKTQAKEIVKVLNSNQAVLIDRSSAKVRVHIGEAK